MGDQLTPAISSLRDASPAETILLMAEVAEEAGYVPHHRKKLAFLFSAMRHFAEEMRAQGWRVDYVRLDDPDTVSYTHLDVYKRQCLWFATAVGKSIGGHRYVSGGQHRTKGLL